MSGCELCELQAGIERGENPWAVARLQSGFVALSPLQYFRGYTYFSAKRCVGELHLLGRQERDLFLHEMAEVAHALVRAFGPQKMNYELLGNFVSHLHWHLVPRHEDDVRPTAPIWENLEFLRLSWTGVQEQDESVRRAMVSALMHELERADVVIERAYA
jgi:diadenosine tetraphosphate (Ap4A) HIT family hydrolase